MADVGAPLRMAVPSPLRNETPLGNLPFSVILAGGGPLVVTGKENWEPTVAVVADGFVKPG